MKKGDLVLVTFPFTDLSGNKNRPALVLYNDSVDVILAFITTRFNNQEKTDVTIEPTVQNGLKRKSLIRVSKIATLHLSLVIGKLGDINDQQLNILNTHLAEVLSLNS